MYRFGPLLLTLLLIGWTISVSTYTKYGDNWAIYPTIALFVAMLAWHLALILKFEPRGWFIAYAFAHGVVFFVIWLICVMRISKDSV